VVAGIRDAARTAARQATGQNDTWPLATPCGYCAHTLNWHVTGGRCRVTAGENGCGCTTFVAPDGSHPDHPHHAPAVGQPAEAHDTDEDHLAAAISAGDVEINHGGHPTWEELSDSGRENYRWIARHLLARFSITARPTMEDET
jgi:hypothetical protein